MGREVRRVPAGWEHPVANRRPEPDSFQPLHDQSYRDAAEKWEEGYALWRGGVCGVRSSHRDDPVFRAIVRFDAACRRAAVWFASIFDRERGQAIAARARAEGVFYYRGGSEGCDCYWDWTGPPPEDGWYRPDWADDERTHFQFYENVSEGTPLSPPCASLEELARWLSENPGMGVANLDYLDWLNVVCDGYIPSLAFSPQHGVEMGSEFVARTAREER